MEAIDIVKTLNIYLEKEYNKSDRLIPNQSEFILQKNTKDSIVKAYKEYSYTLWYVNGKQKIKVVTIVHSSRAVTEAEKECIEKHMNRELLLKCFSLVNDKHFKQMIEGEFTGYGNE